MEINNLKDAAGWFSVLQTDKQAQTAVMKLAPGSWSGEKGNEHPESLQILMVVEGEVIAEIGDERNVLHAGDVVLVEPGAEHRFGNETRASALTFNVYVPPAY